MRKVGRNRQIGINSNKASRTNNVTAASGNSVVPATVTPASAFRTNTVTAASGNSVVPATVTPAFASRTNTVTN